MKSIREMAIEYGKEEYDIDVPPTDYVNGANAVLKEIEKMLDEFANYEDSLIVRRVIEQLKK